jgi:simple sugar transport system substrate-binding protein
MRILVAAAGAALALAVTAGVAQADPLKVCFVYVGPHNDGGYSQQHDMARQMVATELGDKVDASTYLENVSEADAETPIRGLAQSGCKLIFSTSFGFQDPTLKVAGDFPDVKFEHATGFMTADNVSTYNIRWYEGRYVMGQIAAKMSKTGTAGYIVSFPIPEVVMGIDAFMLGAQSVNPNFKLKVVWVNTWFDPGKEGDAAKTLFDQGADIIVQHTDSPAPLQIAEQRKLHGFGQATDMIKFGPDAQYTSLVDNWGPYYIKEIQAAMNGTWKTQEAWGGFKDGLVVLAPFTNMPPDVAAMANATIDKIKGGFNPFTGPITKQDGSVGVPAGKTISDADLLALNWYVKGIDDKLPQ